MTNEEKTLRLAEPSRVVRVTLERDDELTITIDLVPRGQTVDSLTRLTFRGATDVRFRGSQTELTEVVLLLAEDITARGWEGVRFHVKDYEEEFISFFCRDIERSEA